MNPTISMTLRMMESSLSYMPKEERHMKVASDTILQSKKGQTRPENPTEGHVGQTSSFTIKDLYSC